MSRNGWVSIVAVTIGIVALWWFQKRAEPRTLVGPPSFLAPGPASSPLPAGGDPEERSSDAEGPEPESPVKRE
jgi:hypothetical protein